MPQHDYLTTFDAKTEEYLRAAGSLHVGAEMRCMPVWLERNSFFDVPLEQTCQSA